MAEYIIHTKDRMKLDEIVGRIKPVVRFNKNKRNKRYYADRRGELHYIEDVNPKDNFLYDPKPLKTSDDEFKIADDIVEFARIKTYHDFGALRYFAPSIFEVAQQIPEEFIRDVHAFETRRISGILKISGSDYHKAETILYKKK